MRFYLQGQEHYGNRGCEALVRCTADSLKEVFGDAEILVPSMNRDGDLAQWPEAPEMGVRYTRAVPGTDDRVFWASRLVRKLPVLFHEGWFPRFRIPRSVRRDIESCDAVITIGGDTITLDNGIGFLMLQLQLCEAALESGVPVLLWGASVGPFDRAGRIEAYIRKVLSRMSAITARETVTVNYLQELGLDNVRLVADPAFTLRAEALDMGGFWPEEAHGGVLGLNISPMIRKIRARTDDEEVLIGEVAGFIRDAVKERDMSVVLVPHVEGLRNRKNSDSIYMERIRQRVRHLGKRVSMVPDGKNAAELKYVIANCRFYIGSRTHSTIAALSSCVPTVSIAYSRKARGLNKDLFGNQRYVLETPKISRRALNQSLARLWNEESDIRDHLRKTIPVWKDKGKESARVLAKVLAGHPSDSSDSAQEFSELRASGRGGQAGG